MRDIAQAEKRRLLRFLFLRVCQMPAYPAASMLLCRIGVCGLFLAGNRFYVNYHVLHNEDKFYGQKTVPVIICIEQQGLITRQCFS